MDKKELTSVIQFLVAGCVVTLVLCMAVVDRNPELASNLFSASMASIALASILYVLYY